MTATLIKYGQHPKVPPGAICEGCNSAKATGTDHCHDHGWVRGLLCTSCNRLMYIIDRLMAPKAESVLIRTLLMLRHRCPECEQITIAALGACDLPTKLRPKRKLSDLELQRRREKMDEAARRLRERPTEEGFAKVGLRVTVPASPAGTGSSEGGER
jgi:hypothetical protein